jgi:2-haloacid dehalogenase
VTTLIFDVMGTVVDIEGSIARQAREVTGLDEDALSPLLSDWDERLEHAMAEIIAGRAEWRPHEQLRREALPEGLPETLAGVVHRLDPWPDSPAALARLREQHHVVALSNADLHELVDLSKHGGLAWHALLSAQFARSYKPDPAVYDMALELLGIEPADAMLVAAHPWDLRGAAARGYATAYVARPDAVPPAGDDEFDVHVRDLAELADR